MTTLLLKDSVVSPILTQFKGDDEDEITYADDEPIIGRKVITDALDNIQDRFTNLLITSTWTETDKYLKRIEPALNKAARSLLEKKSVRARFLYKVYFMEYRRRRGNYTRITQFKN